MTTVDYEHVIEEVTRQYASSPNSDGLESTLKIIAKEYQHDTTVTWSEGHLSLEELRSVILPWHVCGTSEHTLVPSQGTTVGEICKILAQRPTDLVDSCTGKIHQFRVLPKMPAIISNRSRPGIDYRDCKYREGWFHVDGLHRMIAWGLSSCEEGIFPVFKATHT